MSQALAVLFWSILTVGCRKPIDVSRTDVRMHGDLGSFLAQQISHYGGRGDLFTNHFMPTNCSWRFRADQEGFQIFTDATLFDKFDQTIQAALGSPDIVNENTPGRKFRVFNVRRAGVAIQYTVSSSPFPDVPNPLLHSIFIKPQKQVIPTE
jgi:hypothetical protein